MAVQNPIPPQNLYFVHLQSQQPQATAGFSVTPFRIDQNRIQNRSIQQVHNLRKERR